MHRTPPGGIDDPLGDITLFRSLSEDERKTIARYATIRHYRKNTVLIEQGDEAISLYILLDGRVKIYASDDDREIVLNEFVPGSYFGELALLGGETRVASAITLTECTLLILSKASFLQLITSHPEMTMQVLLDLVDRVRRLTDELTSLAFMDVYGRIARLLMDSVSEEDGRRITARFTHQDIANRVGASREMVTRILRDLRAGGYLSVDRKRFVVEKKLPPRW